MRKLVLIGAGAGAAAIGLAALAFTSGTSGAEAPRAVADSATAPVLAPGDTAKLLGPRQPVEAGAPPGVAGQVGPPPHRPPSLNAIFIGLSSFRNIGALGFGRQAYVAFNSR